MCTPTHGVLDVQRGSRLAGFLRRRVPGSARAIGQWQGILDSRSADVAWPREYAPWAMEVKINSGRLIDTARLCRLSLGAGFHPQVQATGQSCYAMLTKLNPLASRLFF